MTTEEWLSLVSAPGWPKLRKYLADHRSSIAEGLAQGKFAGEKVQEAIYRCQLLKDMSELSLKDIDTFYGIEPKPEESAEDES